MYFPRMLQEDSFLRSKDLNKSLSYLEDAGETTAFQQCGSIGLKQRS